MTRKQEIAAKILQKSVELLTPLSTDVNGVHNPEQKKMIAVIHQALGDVVLMDTVELDTHLVTVRDLQKQLKYLSEYTVTVNYGKR